jgi:quercetin dioxygenase-like cupin family protein
MLKVLILSLLPAIAVAQVTKPVIDNERVKVWDVDWSQGALPAADFAKYDCVVVFTKAGQLRKVSSVSPTTVVTHAAGEVMYLDQLAVDKLEAPPGSMPHTVVIFIKTDPMPPLENKSGQPNAFPRPGGKRVMNNARFTTWDYTWTPGQPTPMHFHDKDVVVVYLEDGSLKSTTPDGQVTVNDYTAGSIRYNARDRVHTEEVVKGTQHALITEIK